jgi:hypothetical protein
MGNANILASSRVQKLQKVPDGPSAFALTLMRQQFLDGGSASQMWPSLTKAVREISGLWDIDGIMPEFLKDQRVCWAVYKKKRKSLFSEWEPEEVAEIVAMCWNLAPKEIQKYISGTYLDNTVYASEHRELWCCFYACLSLGIDNWRGFSLYPSSPFSLSLPKKRLTWWEEQGQCSSA